MPDQSFENIDAGRGFDWGRASADYDLYRPGPPDSFYVRLSAFGIGLPDQRMLDLGTGTGLLARRFAAQRAAVAGIDLSDGQVDMARAAAKRESLKIDFRQASAEDIPFSDDAFDVVTANQCWTYFDLKKTVPEVLRVLGPDGRLVVSHFSFMPHLDPIVRASEGLVLKYNPDWSGANWDGVLAAEPSWARKALDLVGLFVYEEKIPFTRQSWRGRMRALRGIAASLSDEEVAAFDSEHDVLLGRVAPETFDICHRIHAHIYRPK